MLVPLRSNCFDNTGTITSPRYLSNRYLQTFIIRNANCFEIFAIAFSFFIVLQRSMFNVQCSTFNVQRDSISTPCSVISTVCSHWALGFSSSVITSQP